jgi:hypothetical protein
MGCSPPGRVATIAASWSAVGTVASYFLIELRGQGHGPSPRPLRRWLGDGPGRRWSPRGAADQPASSRDAGCRPVCPTPERRRTTAGIRSAIHPTFLRRPANWILRQIGQELQAPWACPPAREGLTVTQQANDRISGAFRRARSLVRAERPQESPHPSRWSTPISGGGSCPEQSDGGWSRWSLQRAWPSWPLPPPAPTPRPRRNPRGARPSSLPCGRGLPAAAPSPSPRGPVSSSTAGTQTRWTPTPGPSPPTCEVAGPPCLRPRHGRIGLGVMTRPAVRPPATT